MNNNDIMTIMDLYNQCDYEGELRERELEKWNNTKQKQRKHNLTNIQNIQTKENGNDNQSKTNH